MGAEDARTPTTAALVGRQADYWLTTYRRTWKGSAVMSFVQPWLYIGAMGVLLGTYVDEAAAASGDPLGAAPSYLAFVAPGLLASTAMQIGSDETMWPVLSRIKWDRSYLAMVATPLRPVDIVLGHLGFTLARVALTSAAFLIPIVLLGLASSALGVLVAFCGALLTGLGLAAPIYAFSAGAANEQAFALIFRIVVMPMFLFSGAFFPVSNLGSPWELLAQLTPLYHGVELCRMGTLGTWDSSGWLHAGYLAALAALGVWLGARRLTRRLVV